MNPVYTESQLIAKLINIRNMGWIENRRPNNVGGIGNTLEDLLGIPENNLAVANSGEWELKSHREGSGSLTTLFHSEPSPRKLKIVPSILLPKYGWGHEKAGTLYPVNEMSFRQTINAISRTDRGFRIIVNRNENKIEISFDYKSVSTKQHKEWLISVEKRVGNLNELNPQPYWGFNDLYYKGGTKLLNCFYITAKVKKCGKKECYLYDNIKILSKFDKDKFIKGIENGLVLIDFDARTGHNHGTKFRIRGDKLPELYSNCQVI